MNILSIVIKNLTIILRSKLTILMLILAPILLMSLTGLVYNTNDYFSETSVGYFGETQELFTFTGMDFKHYGSDTQENKLQCIIDVKKGLLDLCLNLTIQEDNAGNMASAQITYHKDNTRNTFSNILINALERQLKEKTKEISEKSITSIFDEIQYSLDAINNSKETLDEIIDLSLEVEYDLQANEDDIKNNIQIILDNTNALLDDQSDLQKSITALNEDDSTQDIANSIQQINEIQDALSDIENTNQDAIATLFFLKSISDDEYEEDFEEVIDQLSTTEEYSNDLQQQTSEASQTLEDLKSTLALNEFGSHANTIDNMYEEIEELQPSIIDLQKNFDSLTTTLSDTNDELLLAKQNIDDKYNFFLNLTKQNSSSITQPISTTSSNLIEDDFGRIHELSPAIITLVILFVGLLLSNIIVSLEINSKAYFRNLIAPVSQLNFIVALFITSIIIISFQLLFFFLILYFVFDISNIIWYIPEILIIVFHGLLVFVLMGIFLAYLFSSMQLSILVTTFMILALFLVSDIIVPLQLMPNFFGNLIQYNPVVIIEETLRKIFFYGEHKAISLFTLFPFYIYTLFLMVGIGYANWRRRHKAF